MAGLGAKFGNGAQAVRSHRQVPAVTRRAAVEQVQCGECAGEMRVQLQVTSKSCPRQIAGSGAGVPVELLTRNGPRSR